MSKYRLHIVHFTFGRRGWMSDILLRRDDGAEAFGIVFYAEVFPDQEGYPIVTPTAGRAWLEANLEAVWEGLLDLDDDGLYPGWARNPATEQVMLERARRAAGWED